jgi:hypothetical protein
MRPKLSPPAGARVAEPHTQRAVPGERRVDLVGAESGAGSGRSRRAAVHRVQVRVRRPPGPPPGTGEPADASPGEVQQLHRRGERGATSTPTGCNGAATGSSDCTRTAQATIYGTVRLPARARGTATAAGGGRPTGEFFAALGDRWRLTATHWARLAPAMRAALCAGRLRHALAGKPDCQHERHHDRHDRQRHHPDPVRAREQRGQQCRG